MQNQGRICPRGAGYYDWKEGDTLSSVARVHGTTAQAIQILNEGVDFSTLAAGTEICMPSQSHTCVTGRAYAVQHGETFTSIAEQLGITVHELQERNPGVDSSNLTIGQVICIPESGTSTPPTPSEPSAPGISCPIGYEARTIQEGQTYADLLVDLNVSYRAMRAGTPYCAPPSGTRQACAGSRAYTIQPGETLDSLAESLGTTRGRLLMLNPTLVPTDFSSGTIICIP